MHYKDQVIARLIWKPFCDLAAEEGCILDLWTLFCLVKQRMKMPSNI